MPRQPSQSSSNKNPSYTPRPHSPLAPPMPQTQTVQVQPPSFFSSVVQGFGLGAGSSIAHNMFDSNKTIIHKQDTPHLTQYTGPCATQKDIFDKCIKNRQSIEECERNLKDLRACYDQYENKSS